MRKYKEHTTVYEFDTTGIEFFASSGYLIGHIAEHAEHNGTWVSVGQLNPEYKDWWRSRCGYAVDNTFDTCPVCEEAKPNE